jgi:hypothetical protein
MPGSLQIQTRVGCDADEVIMTLSGTAEPNGGDHVAVVDFTGQSQNRMLTGLLSVELETAPGVWIGVTVQSFLFTSAGETYTLRARGSEMLMNWPGIIFPYTVYAIYAPSWASLDGILTGNPVDEECCIPVGESTTEQLFYNGYIQAAGGGSTLNGTSCTVNTTAPWLFFSNCTTTNYSSPVYNYTPSLTIYDWFDKSFSLSATRSFSHNYGGIASSVSVTFSIVKSAGSNNFSFSFTFSGSASGTYDDVTAVPSQESTIPDQIVLDIPCSLYKFTLDIAYERIALFNSGGVLSVLAEINNTLLYIRRVP